MHRKFIALIIATAVAVTGLSAAPARADENDLVKFLAGFAALAIIGSAIHNRDRDDAPVTHYVTPPKHPIPPRPLPPQVSKLQLPQQCLHTYSVHNKPRRLFGARCLKRTYSYNNSLPRACQFQFRHGNETRTGYEPVCLRERGYRTARR